MLDSMRGLAKSFVSKALMLLLVLSFALWGVGDIVRGGGNDYLVKVGDEKITANVFMAEQRSMRQTLEQMGVKNIRDEDLQNEILRRMVQQKLIALWQRDSGLIISESTLAQSIARDAEFKGIDGKFDPAMFAQSLQLRRTNERSYLAELSMQMGGKAMLASIDSSDMSTAASLGALAQAAAAQTRDAVLFTVAPTRINPSSVTKEEAEAYYAANDSRFLQPERRTLEYVVFSPAPLSKKALKLSKEDQALHQEQAIRELATAVEDALAAGSSLGEALAEAGVTTQSKLLTDITAQQFVGGRDALLAAVAEQGFSLGEGENSSMQSLEQGADATRYFMANVRTITAASPKPFAAVEADIRRAVADEKTASATRQRVTALKKALATESDWKKVAADARATAREVRGVRRPDISADGKVANAGALPALLQQALFEHKKGGVAGPVSQANGTQTLALVTAVHNSSTRASKSDAAAANTETAALSGDSISAGVFRALAARYPVVVNQPMLAQLNGQPE